MNLELNLNFMHNFEQKINTFYVFFVLLYLEKMVQNSYVMCHDCSNS